MHSREKRVNALLTLKKGDEMNNKTGKNMRQPLWLRVLSMIAIGIVLLVLAGAAYQSVATAVDARRYPPPGEFIDVGGHRLHLYCQGEGSPTVILEAGAMSFSSSWLWVQPEVAKRTRVCSYDRAGHGWSDPGPEPRDAIRVTGELNALLANVGIEGPYVMAGHSWGGMYNRVFTHQYPEKITGLVFVDAQHPEFWTRSPGGQEGLDGVLHLFRLGSFLAPLGVPRLLGDIFGMTHGLSEDVANVALATTARPKFWRTTLAEGLATPSSSQQVLRSGSLGNRPLVVLTRGRPNPGESEEEQRAWLAMQEDLVGLSTNSRHEIVEGSDHMGILTQREPALVVAGAILEVVEEVRQATDMAD
jgi:pimeloyl-ACP methyl ester carboxylesterase